MLKSLEHHEHAEHMAHQAAEETGGADHGGHGSGGHEAGGHAAAHQASRMAALLVAVLAAGLALSEQGAKHAEIRVQESSIAAADAWAQFQAKSTRATLSKDIASVVAAMDPSTPEATARRTKLLAELEQDRDRYERDPKDGKDAIGKRARGFEQERDHSLEQTHAYHNGSAAMELGIVLATASAIIGSRLLIWLALVVGIAGVVFAGLGFVAPEYGAI